MTRLTFVVPVHGREDLTRVCLRQLRRTCDALAPAIEATAVVVGEDDSLRVAYDLGFGTVRRSNRFLGMKFNDGYQLACDPAFNPEPADYCVPCGSDDWIDPVIFRQLPGRGHIGVFRHLAVVNEDRTHLSKLTVGYRGGAGIRIVPRDLIELCGYRPAEEDRKRAIDTSTLFGFTKALNGQQPPLVPLDVHELQIVDFKTHGQQLNPYSALRSYRRGSETEAVFAELAEFYPAEAINEMQACIEFEMAARDGRAWADDIANAAVA